MNLSVQNIAIALLFPSHFSYLVVCRTKSSFVDYYVLPASFCFSFTFILIEKAKKAINEKKKNDCDKKRERQSSELKKEWRKERKKCGPEEEEETIYKSFFKWLYPIWAENLFPLFTHPYKKTKKQAHTYTRSHLYYLFHFWSLRIPFWGEAHQFLVRIEAN